jgi:hypothetical protein
MKLAESIPLQLDNLLIAIEDAAYIQELSPEIAEHFAANALTTWDQFLLSAPLAARTLIYIFRSQRGTLVILKNGQIEEKKKVFIIMTALNDLLRVSPSIIECIWNK